MKSTAATVDAYIEELPPERAEHLKPLVQAIRKNIPKGYEETMSWGMPCWEIPLSTFPNTYNKRPLMYLAAANQKNHLALYMSVAYGSQDIRKIVEQLFTKEGKKLDMGGSCIRFKKLSDLPLEGLMEIIKRVKPEDYIAYYEAARPAKN